MPSDADRTRAIVSNGRPTRRTPGGWQLDNIRLAKYPKGHWAFASLQRTPNKPVLMASNKQKMLKAIEAVMDEIERRVVVS